MVGETVLNDENDERSQVTKYKLVEIIANSFEQECNFVEIRKASGGTAGIKVDKPMHTHDIWMEIPDFFIVRSPNKSFGQLKT
uniref:Uncharacterized protein n=1 Tax=Onchocerca volvulus TaxID=6282 RepID=A0A8R1TK35_ONCVO